MHSNENCEEKKIFFKSSSRRRSGRSLLSSQKSIAKKVLHAAVFYAYPSLEPSTLVQIFWLFRAKILAESSLRKLWKFFEPCQNFLLKISNAGEKNAEKSRTFRGKMIFWATLISGFDTIFRLDRRKKVPAIWLHYSPWIAIEPNS